VRRGPPGGAAGARCLWSLGARRCSPLAPAARLFVFGLVRRPRWLLTSGTRLLAPVGRGRPPPVVKRRPGVAPSSGGFWGRETGAAIRWLRTFHRRESAPFGRSRAGPSQPPSQRQSHGCRPPSAAGREMGAPGEFFFSFPRLAAPLAAWRFAGQDRLQVSEPPAAAGPRPNVSTSC